MNNTILPLLAMNNGNPPSSGYLLAGLLALLILIYLVYTLIRPEKF
ncbi:MAG: potassium-transporting ATPase subunit F [Bacteroidales bacterium]